MVNIILNLLHLQIMPLGVDSEEVFSLKFALIITNSTIEIYFPLSFVNIF